MPCKRHSWLKKVSNILLNEISIKCKNFCSPTFSCVIGDNAFDRALFDSEASVDLLPNYIYMKLGLRDLKPTYVLFQLVEKSIKIPRRIIKDVLV